MSDSISFAVAFVVVLTLLSGLITQRIIGRPLETLAAAMRDVEAGDLSRRIPVETVDDIGKLSQGFNSMLGRLSQADAQIRAFNQRLPLNMLAQAAVGTTLPGDLRDQLAARTWLRAAILDDVAIARDLQPLVAGKYPEFRPYLEQFGQADTVEARRFALVFMVMHFAGVQPPQEKVGYLIVGMVVIMVVIWFAGLKDSFKGPPIGEEIKKRQAAIAAQEKALDAAT